MLYLSLFAGHHGLRPVPLRRQGHVCLPHNEPGALQPAHRHGSHPSFSTSLLLLLQALDRLIDFHCPPGYGGPHPLARPSARSEHRPEAGRTRGWPRLRQRYHGWSGGAFAFATFPSLSPSLTAAQHSGRTHSETARGKGSSLLETRRPWARARIRERPLMDASGSGKGR